MIKMSLRLVCLVLALLLVVTALPALASSEWEEEAESAETAGDEARTNGDASTEKGQIRCLLSCEGEEMALSTVLLLEEEWLFLPTFADKTALSLVFPEELAAQGLNIHCPTDKNNILAVPEDGHLTLDWTAMASPEEDGVSYVLLKDGAGQYVLTLNVMQSANLRALFLISDDPVNEGRVWLGDCDHHERSTTASLMLVGQEGTVDHEGKIEKLRGRGNGTWARSTPKKPYQIKMKKKTDLLDLGTPEAPAKKFVLLAEQAMDSMLNNSISYGLARAAGMDVPHFEQVDLYYDGEYRGFYLLCERVEVGPGRMNITNYDKIIERQNGDRDLKELTLGTGKNRYGFSYTYAEGLRDTGDPTDGGYVLELMRYGELYLDDPCWFELPTGQPVAVKNPEYASESMMRYISEKLCHLYQTLMNGGVNPEDGTLLAEEVDVNTLSAQAAFQELIMNKDGLRYSFFYLLDAGESRFAIGPVWDCDFSMLHAIRDDETWYSPLGFQDESRNMNSLLFERLPEARTAMAEAIDLLAPLVEKLISGEGDGDIETLDELYARLTPSLRMNLRLYNAEKYWLEGWDSQMDQFVERIRELLKTRLDWMTDYLHSDWQTLQLEIRAPYGMAEQAFAPESDVIFLATVEDADFEQVSEATAEEYAQYRFTLIVEPAEGMTVNRVTVNGVEFPYETLEDGNLRVEGYFWEDGYRPVEYNGQDVGLIYDEEAFRQNDPELSEEYGDDSEGLLDYFMQEGIYEGLKGNAFFDPHWVCCNWDSAAADLGDSWDLYYDMLLTSGPEVWLNHGDMMHRLPVAPLEVSEE